MEPGTALSSTMEETQVRKLCGRMIRISSISKHESIIDKLRIIVIIKQNHADSTIIFIDFCLVVS